MEPLTRRRALGLAAGLIAVGGSPRHAWATAEPRPSGPPPADDPELRALEQRHARRLGVCAYNIATGVEITHRADERFPILSVFKTLLAGLVLQSSSPTALAERLTWSAGDVVVNSPVTELTVRNGLTVAQLCEAAVTRSDNTAANVLMGRFAGPGAVTEFARSLGDDVTRLDRLEPDLNSAVPGDERDTTTPRAIGHTYERLLLGSGTARPDQRLLLDWMLANQTTTARFGAGVPAGWRLADKTGAGAYGTVNDVGIAWTPDGAPIVMAALTAGLSPDDPKVDQLLADVAANVTRRLS